MSEIQKIAQDIVPELRRRIDEWLASGMVLGSLEHERLELELWENKVGILRVLECALSPPEPTAHHEMFMAGMHALEVAIECDDPKRELALRIKDLIAEAKAFRSMPLQNHAEIERLKLELGRTQGEVVQRQDELGRLLHAAEAKNEQQAKHVEELHAKMTCMCGDPVDHSPWSGHSPISMFDYAVEQEVERRLAGQRPMVAEEQTEAKP